MIDRVDFDEFLIKKVSQKVSQKIKNYSRRNTENYGWMKVKCILVYMLRMLISVYVIFACSCVKMEQSSGTSKTPNDKASLSSEEKQWIEEYNGKIRIGITVIPPQVLYTSNKYEGLSIDYIKLMEQKLGCQFVLVPYTTWNDVIESAKKRRIDMIFAAQQTPERLHYLMFSAPYIVLPNMIIVRKDTKGGNDLKQMQGWSVATSEGSAVHEYLKNNFTNLVLDPVPDELTGLMQVSLGETDAMVVEISRASYYIEKQGIMNLRIAGEADLVYQLRFAVRNDWPKLCNILDKGLSMITPEERREISRRWIIIEEKRVFVWKIFCISLTIVLGVIVLAIVASFAWTKTLRRMVKYDTAQLQKELAERKRTEEALQQSEERFRMAQAIGHIGNWEYNLETTEFWGSDEAKRIYGFDHGQFNFTADEVEKCIPERERVHQALVDLIEKNKPYNLEFEIHPLNSSKPKIIMSIAELIKDENGNPFKVMGVIQDITARKQAEEEVYKLNQELVTNKELEAFAYSVSHDLKTPLRSVCGFSQILLEEDSININSQGKYYLQKICSAAERMGQIIEDMLNLSRVTRNEMEVKPVNLSILFKEIADVFCKNQPERSVDIVIGPDIIVNGDQNLLRIALENLFCNAWKFTSQQTEARIEFGMIKKRNEIIYYLKDNGVGFDMNYSKNLFLPFQRLHASKEFSGTGVGLAIVRRVIDRHEGKVWAEGEIEKGAIFYFTIPLKK